MFIYFYIIFSIFIFIFSNLIVSTLGPVGRNILYTNHISGFIKLNRTFYNRPPVIDNCSVGLCEYDAIKRRAVTGPVIITKPFASI